MDVVHPGAFNLPPYLRSEDSILWQMALVALHGCEKSFSLLQESIFHLHYKALQDELFSEQEIRFVQTLLTCPWWGGLEYGANQARCFDVPQGFESLSISGGKAQNVTDPAQISLAQMAHHYVHGEGQIYPIRLPIYSNSIIVKDTIAALKSYICELYTFQKPATLITTADRGFLHSNYAKRVEQKRLQSDVSGYIFSDGTLLLEQKDPRILQVGNRFKISAMTSSMGVHLMTRWRIDGVYRFECVGEEDTYTGLPMTENLVLQVPNRLACHMAQLGAASAFNYFGDWVERYPLIKM